MDKETITEKILKKSVARVLKTLYDKPEKHWTMTEIHEESKLSRPTVRKTIEDLKDFKLLKKRKKGNLSLIQLNTEAETYRVIKKLIHLDKQITEKQVKPFTEELWRKMKGKINSIILYGSAARGTLTPKSDIDILVLTSLEKDVKAVEKEARELSEGYTERSLPIETMTMSTAEFKEKKHRGNDFVKSVQEDHEHLKGEEIEKI